MLNGSSCRSTVVRSGVFFRRPRSRRRQASSLKKNLTQPGTALLMQEGMTAASTEVRVNQHNVPAVPGKGNRKIEYGGCRSFAGTRTGKKDRTRRLFRPQGERGAQ